MAREPRITTRCPKCEKRWLRVEAGGPCGKRTAADGWPSGARVVTCDGIVEAVPPNAPRSTSGKRRVRMGVNLLPETAKVLTATEVAALADGHVVRSARGEGYRRHIVHRDRCMDFGHMKGLEAADALDAFAAWVDRESPELGRLTGDKQVKAELDALDAWRASSDAVKDDQ